MLTKFRKLPRFNRLLTRFSGNAGGGLMKDEYDVMDSSGKTYCAKNFTLESGVMLPEVQVRYSTYGKLNANKDNVLVVCHALTGNSNIAQWWGFFLGAGLPFNTDKYYVVCANVLGSCYGSTGPKSVNPITNKLYGNDFPHVTIRDTVKAHLEMIKNEIGATSIASVIGGSMGGMQALEWCIIGKELVKSAIIIGCGSRHTAWQIAISETQRQAIYRDPKWNNGNVDMANPPVDGLELARQIAMISYRTATSFDRKYQVRKYLEYQGKKFISRFDPISYLKITEQLDSHDVGRDRGGVTTALSTITCPTLIIGIDSDVLYPLYEQEELAKYIPSSAYSVIQSTEGHDGFLLEQKVVGDCIQTFLDKQ